MCGGKDPKKGLLRNSRLEDVAKVLLYDIMAISSPGSGPLYFDLNSGDMCITDIAGGCTRGLVAAMDKK
jgi:hypothetical protein